MINSSVPNSPGLSKEHKAHFWGTEVSQTIVKKAIQGAVHCPRWPQLGLKVVCGAHEKHLMDSYRMVPPSDVCWFINPMKTIVISAINHSEMGVINQLS